MKQLTFDPMFCWLDGIHEGSQMSQLLDQPLVPIPQIPYSQLWTNPHPESHLDIDKKNWIVVAILKWNSRIHIIVRSS